MKRWRMLLTLFAGVSCGVPVNAEPELPDVDLLEFLGSWEGEDDEWQVFFDSLPYGSGPGVTDQGLRAGERNHRDDQEKER